jgi:ABC-type uncharacterized transport system substrate-binding protein
MSINRIYIPASLSLNIDGTVHIKADKELMQSYYREIIGHNDEVDVEITITRIDSKKTNPQLAYFFAVVLPIIKQRFEDLEGTTFTKGEIMSILKDRFFYEEIYYGGEFVKEYLSLSKASKEEVKKFIENCIEFATDILDIEIPEPSKL